jgi:phospholipid/cholesterol/gamma-HCH transport system substrate-binding protein
MQERLKAARVGALVVAALVAGFLVYRAVEERSSQGEGYRVYALFDDAQGLITKSRVTIAGITVGRIESIRLEGAQARVDMTIHGDVALYEDASVRRVSASLLGEYLLAIHPGTPTRRRLGNGERIRVVIETPTMGDIMENVGAVARSVRAVAGQLERSFGTDEAGQQMTGALRNLSEALEAVNRTIQANEEVVGRTLQNVEGITGEARPILHQILRNIEDVTARLRDLVAANQADLDEGLGEVDETIASIHRASEQLEQVLADVSEITERTAAGEGTVGRLTSDEHLIDEVEHTVEGVADVVGGIFRLRTIMELRSEYNFLANTFKNYFSVRIQPREGRYYLVQLIDEPRGRTQLSTTQVRRSPPAAGEPEFWEETRVTTTEQLVFTLMLAQRVYFATFRFGVLESSGGLGLDLNFFDDRLELNVDIFQFGYSQFARIRARVAFELVPSLFILGGVDDVLNDRTVDLFLGAMLRFDDQDLAGLFPFVGGAAAGLAN